MIILGLLFLHKKHVVGTHQKHLAGALLLSTLAFISIENLGLVVQRVVSLTSLLRVISLTVLADSVHNILIFFAEKNVSSFCTAKATHIFSAKNFRIFAYHSM